MHRYRSDCSSRVTDTVGVGRALVALLLALLLQASASPAAAQDGPVSRRIQQSLALIHRTDAHYRAIIALDPDAVNAARSLERQRKAPGLLFGEPVLLKDNIESRGLPTSAGSLALADNDTGRDASLVARLRAEDAVILGKTNLSEWANFRSEHSISGWSAVGGQTRNAHARERTPCGSSSGSAVAVALAYVNISIGTETSGSIVCPAAVNGVVGFKPTQGLVSGAGIVPLATSQDTAGPITDNVENAARTLAVISDQQHPEAAAIRRGLLAYDALESLEGLRIGVNAASLGFDRRRDAALAQVLDTLEALGATLVTDLRIERYPDFSSDSYDVLLYEFRRDLNAYLAALPSSLNTLTLDALIAFNEEHAAQEMPYFDQSIFLRAASIADTEDEYRAKREAIRRATREEGFERLFAEHELDAFIGITTSPAWMIDRVNGDAWFGPGMAGNAAIAGNPHITLPLAEISGLPLGISLVGRRWEDHRLAQIAWLLERRHAKPTYRAGTGNPAVSRASRSGSRAAP